LHANKPISKTASHTKAVAGQENAISYSTINRNAQIRCMYIECRPKGQGWSARTESVPKKP